MPRCFRATERNSFEEALARLPAAEAHARTLLPRLALLCPLPQGAPILDVGAAQGRFLIACAKMGFQALGVEPWADAIGIAFRLAKHEGCSIQIVPGTAEALPFQSERFRLVHAASVMEHVADVEAAFAEAYRVLMPGGAFWFHTASSLCPRQDEIGGFPCFGWYPDRLKRRIMDWAVVHKPHLVGHTTAPAINWFTPWKARRMLRRAGFGRVLDRWELPPGAQMSGVRRTAYCTIGRLMVLRLAADVVRPGCAYVAVK